MTNMPIYYLPIIYTEATNNIFNNWNALSQHPLVYYESLHVLSNHLT